LLGVIYFVFFVCESASAAVSRSKDERNFGDYSTMSPWYSQAYGYDLQGKISSAYFRFYFNPSRMLRISKQFPLKNIYIGMMSILVKKVVSIAWKFKDGLRGRS